MQKLKSNIFVKINVKVNKSEEKIIKLGDSLFEVHVNVPPTEGKANKRAVELLSKHFKSAKSNFRIIKGAKSRNKVVEILS